LASPIEFLDGRDEETGREAASQGQEVDVKELLRMEPESGTTNIET
jgi:hypothetical protein